MTKPKTPAAPAIAGEPARKSANARTVTVACKIPNGLVLQLCKSHIETEQTMAGSRDVKVYRKMGPTITVAGPAYPNGTVPKGFKRRPEDASNMALTFKVPADFFEEWMKQNADADYVRSGMIFGFADLASVEDQAQELVKELSGFEPVNVDGPDPRVPRPMTAAVTGIETAEEWRGGAAA